MKKTLLSLFAITTIILSSFGQVPEGFKYQAVVRDTGNLILNNHKVGMQFTIQQGLIGGKSVYTETFTLTTNAYGLVNLEIGTGTTADDFTTIDWANGPYFIETAIDLTGGTSYLVMGTSQLMSVPYALHAKTADNVSNDAVDDEDADPTNEIQIIVSTDTNNSIRQGSDGGAYLPSESFYYADADSDGFGNPLAVVYSINIPLGYCTSNNDCDDTNATIHPEAPELCDGIDNNCNGRVDEGFDIDGDGYTTCQGDCDDTDDTVFPGLQNEICGDDIDNNCDGKVDEGCAKLVIGDVYQGGIVAHLLVPGDIGYDPNVPHGLLAAVSDQSTGDNNWLASAAICNAYTDGTYFDWRLPTYFELNYLYINREAIGNFTDDSYWSGTTAGGNAWYQAFSNGFQNNISQVFTFLSSRAVRTF